MVFVDTILHDLWRIVLVLELYMNDKKKLTLDNATVASNPGEIKFEPLVWFCHNQKSALIVSSLLIAPLILAFIISHWFFILAALMCLVNIFYWIRAEEHFTADSNPGLIVSVSPPLYAVYTDLSKGVGKYPVIKVLEYKSRKPINLEQRLATVATYSNGNGDESPSWNDFFPLPVEYATSDQASIEAQFNSYSDQSWKNLITALTELEEPYSPGLYTLKTQNCDW